VENLNELTNCIGHWLKNPTNRQAVTESAQKTVTRLGGALDRTIAVLEPYLLQVRIEYRTADA
jgi:3-deoxy-D-manno-octulosonic-acid transferase